MLTSASISRAPVNHGQRHWVNLGRRKTISSNGTAAMADSKSLEFLRDLGSPPPGTLSYAEAAIEDRSAPRAAIVIPAMLRQSGSHGFKVVVRNISQSGFACDAVTGMTPGTRCWLTLPGIVAQQASVVWNDGFQVGGAFEMLLSPIVLDSLIARYGRVIPGR